MQNKLLFPIVAAIVALVLAAVVVSQQPNNVPQQDAEYSAQTQSGTDVSQSEPVSTTVPESEWYRYDKGQCDGMRYDYSMVQQGHTMSAKAERNLRSELKKCDEVAAATSKKYPSGLRTIVVNPG